MGIFLKISLAVLCVFDGVWAADYDLSVMVSSMDKRDLSVFFSRQDVSLKNTSTGFTQDLHEFLSDMALVGWCFDPWVPAASRRNPLLYTDGVRQAVCLERTFYSEEMRECLALMAGVLCAGGGVVSDGQALAVAEALDGLYTEDKVVEWRCVWARPHWGMAQIQISFRGSNDILLGDVVDKSAMRFELDCSGHLLVERRRLVDEPARLMPARSVPEKTLDRLSFESFLARGFDAPRRGVGFVYFPKDGGKVSALFDVTGATLPADDAAGSPQNLFDVMFDQIFKGYKLKRYICSMFFTEHQTDYGVCEALCSRVCFFSQPLRDACCALLGFLLSPERLRQGADWGGLEQHHFDEMYSEGKTLQWTLVGSDWVFKRVCQSRIKIAPGTVLISMNGYPAVLKGFPTLVGADSDESFVHPGCVLRKIQDRRLLMK